VPAPVPPAWLYAQFTKIGIRQNVAARRELNNILFIGNLLSPLLEGTINTFPNLSIAELL
jgi:hypothetical protein